MSALCPAIITFQFPVTTTEIKMQLDQFTFSPLLIIYQVPVDQASHVTPQVFYLKKKPFTIIQFKLSSFDNTLSSGTFFIISWE